MCVCVCVCAVSYTHLDVYKRQRLQRTAPGTKATVKDYTSTDPFIDRRRYCIAEKYFTNL